MDHVARENEIACKFCSKFPAVDVRRFDGYYRDAEMRAYFPLTFRLKRLIVVLGNTTMRRTWKGSSWRATGPEWVAIAYRKPA